LAGAVGGVEPVAARVAAQGAAGEAAGDAGLPLQIAAVADLGAVGGVVAAHRRVGAARLVEGAAGGVAGEGAGQVAAGLTGGALEIGAVAALGALGHAVTAGVAVHLVEGVAAAGAAQ